MVHFSCYLRVVAMMTVQWATRDSKRKTHSQTGNVAKNRYHLKDRTTRFLKKKKLSTTDLFHQELVHEVWIFSSLSGTACYHPNGCESSSCASLWKWKCKQVWLHRWHSGTPSAPRSWNPSGPLSPQDGLFAICPGRAHGSVFNHSRKIPRTSLPPLAQQACPWVSSQCVRERVFLGTQWLNPGTPTILRPRTIFKALNPWAY